MMTNPTDTYQAASLKTAADLKTIAASPKIAALSRLSLPEIESLTEQIAQVVPAGNVPGLILSGLTRIAGRQVSEIDQQKHLAMLFRGARDLLDKAVYAAVFAGPAAVIMGYQKLLLLAGKDVDSAFPDGTWQFYLNFALREDTARHANEVVGFQQSITAHNIKLSEADALAAWIVTVMLTLQNYNRLLENEWRERTFTALLNQAVDALSLDVAAKSKIQNAYSEWEKQRPYVRGHDAGDLDYPAYRRRKFDQFLQALFMLLPPTIQESYTSAVTYAEQTAQPAYLKQMNILAQLVPGLHEDSHVPYPLEQAQIAVVYQQHYVVFPIWDAKRNAVIDANVIREMAAGLLSHPPMRIPVEADLLLTSSNRASQAGQNNTLRMETAALVDALRTVPIIINWDKLDSRQPLAAIRNTHRGIGDHALTIIFTQDSTVFDQSHIFFDGAWGAALAEIMTGEALSWALYFSQLPDAVSHYSPSTVPMGASPKLREAAQKARLPAEAYAESTAIRLGSVMAVRRLFKTRNDLVTVTVNDLLILYRALHGQRYQPLPTLRRNLEVLWNDSRTESRKAYSAILEAIDKIQRSNPAILIPMDASQLSPRDRLFPTTFRNPMADLLQRHDTTLEALKAYKAAAGDRAAVYAEFDDHQRQYLRMIAGFGELMRKYKDIALSGQSSSTTAIKMLAHIPDAIQKLLDQIPGKFDVLNEVIKGEEVFSNVGRVAKGSTLRRFITAKDDNQQKTLAWGVLTDDQDIVHISLRDFRPHVTLLHNLSQQYGDPSFITLANLITQDFLDSYVDGFNLFIRELRDIIIASRETRSREAGRNGEIL